MLSRIQRKVALSLSASLTIIALVTAPAQAQDAAPVSAEAPDAEATVEGETIIVTGVRGSLARALGQKRNAIGIVDGISAEDIIDLTGPH